MSQLLKSCSDSGAGESLFLSQELSDVTIFVGQGDSNPWLFPVHSLALASQSSVFRRMLENEFTERTTRCITIKDIKPKIVELLLGYIYRGRVSLENWLDGMELLRAAHKYQIDPLVHHCATFLENVLSIANVCYIYNESCLYALVSLKEKCIKLVMDAGFAILRSKQFEVLTKEAVMDIIISPTLNIDSELMVFEALLRWAPMQCCRMGLPVTEANILHELETFLKYMCFDDMSDTEKSALPAAVLSCVQPNNRNRVTHYVPGSLLQHSQAFKFTGDLEFLEYVGHHLTLIHFSLDSALYVLGFRLFVAVAELPCNLPLVLSKESGGTTSVVSCNFLTNASFTLGMPINDMITYDIMVFLKQPRYLEAKTVYELYLSDRTQTSSCPKTKVVKERLAMEKGSASISIHSKCVWGITEIIVM